MISQNNNNNNMFVMRLAGLSNGLLTMMTRKGGISVLVLLLGRGSAGMGNNPLSNPLFQDSPSRKSCFFQQTLFPPIQFLGERNGLENSNKSFSLSS
jgi:hypothetical protein